MLRFTTAWALALALTIGAATAAAGSPDSSAAGPRPDPRAREFSLGIGLVEASLGHASGRTSGMFGIEAGIGGGWPSLTMIPGDHFSDGPVIEVLHLALYLKRREMPRWEHEEGVRTSLFMHMTGNPAGGVFVGGYGSVLGGWKHFKLGPRVLVGWFDEGYWNGFGVSVIPFTMKVLLPY
jgi:hypothetical protein